MPRYNNDPRPHNEKNGEAHDMFNSCLEVSKLAGQTQSSIKSRSFAIRQGGECISKSR